MSSQPKFKSLLHELETLVPSRDKYQIIENRADHFITSGINLIRLIEDTFSEEESIELTRRLVNSLKTNDFSKFHRKVKQLREHHEAHATLKESDNE